MKKHISAFSLLLISLSSMIGSGWLFGSLYSAHYAGPAAILAWPIASVLLLFVALTYAELATMYPHGSSLSAMPLITHGRLTSVILSGLAWISLAVMPVIETQGVMQYASNYIPGIMIKQGMHYQGTPLGYVITLSILLSFVLFNYFGVRLFARINSGLTVWKVIIPILTLVVLLHTSYDPKDFTKYGGFMPYGWKGIMMAMSSGGALFSLLGFRQIVIMMSAVENPGKSVPLTLIASILLTGLLYTALQWAFIGSMRDADLLHGWSHLAFKGDAGPFAALAAIGGSMWLSLLLYADAFVSPYGTALVFSASAAQMLSGMGKVDNAPKVLAIKNQHHAPWVSLLVNFLLAAVMYFILRNWQSMAAFIVSVQIISYAIGPVCLVCLRKQQPDQVRPFRLRFAGLISFIGFYVCTAGAYWCGWNSVKQLLVLSGLGLLCYFIYHYAIKKSQEALNYFQALWLILLILGIGVFSYFGNYGGTHAIPLYWDMLYLAGFSLIIFMLALHTMLEAPMR